MTAAHTICVVICSHQRHVDLMRCLDAIELQTQAPTEVLVVVRETDRDTRLALDGRALGTVPIRMVPVAAPGLIAARTAGLDACNSDFVAMTDDDAVPHADWLERIVQHFLQQPSVAGVGGRDRCLLNGSWDETEKSRVGEIQWFGRLVGYHHLGYGPVRKVQVLKGANMSFRMSAVGSTRVGPNMRGIGAQPHEDSMFSVALRRKGLNLIYDPKVLVDHYEGEREEPRHYAAMLPVKDARAFRDVAFNWALVISTEFSPLRQLVFLVWNLFIGTRIAPGLAQALRFTPTMGLLSWQRFWLTQQGTFESYKLLLENAWKKRSGSSNSRHIARGAGTNQGEET
jgi:GT2 family glycosyltransferase